MHYYLIDRIEMILHTFDSMIFSIFYVLGFENLLNNMEIGGCAQRTSLNVPSPFFATSLYLGTYNLLVSKLTQGPALSHLPALYPSIHVKKKRIATYRYYLQRSNGAMTYHISMSDSQHRSRFLVAWGRRSGVHRCFLWRGIM